tara:strand:+ start:516 stop:1091 length:576 start_codon:yes stop_codon:yes gene_type:complete
MVDILNHSKYLILTFFFIGCGSESNIKSYRTPKKDFGLEIIQKEEISNKGNEFNLTWNLPDTWVPSKGHSMRLASFDVPYSKGVGDLSIVSLSGSSGGLLANVNRWRGQVELEPINETDILTTSTVGESKMGPYRVFKMINENKKGKAIIAAVLPTGEKTFFIKLTTDVQGISELEPSFKKFCSSIGESKL